MKTLTIIEDWTMKNLWILNLDKENILNEEIMINVAAQIYGISNKELK